MVGWHFCTDHNVGRHGGVQVAPLPQAEDDQVFGKRQWDVNLEASTAGFTAVTSAEGYLTSVRGTLRFTTEESQPDELARSVTQGPKHVEVQFPHCWVLKTFPEEAPNGDFTQVRQPSENAQVMRSTD